MSDFDPHSLALIGLLSGGFEAVRDELNRRLAEEGHDEIRDSHGCVFGNIDAGGSRLTDLAFRSGLTKQAVGEVVTELERLGHVARRPDPSDGRAKIIELTPRGAETQAAGYAILAEIEARWAERYGAERVGALRSLLAEVIADERAATPVA